MDKQEVSGSLVMEIDQIMVKLADFYVLDHANLCSLLLITGCFMANSPNSLLEPQETHDLWIC